MNVIEMFTSIQGEGFHMGIPALFVRFAGCNLSCPFCDTKQSWQKGCAEESFSPEQVVESIQRKLQYSPINMIVLTGGEPTINADLPDLVHLLWELYPTICIETNGTSSLDNMPHTYPAPGHVWVTCSPKPQSDYRICCRADELKYVVTGDFDAQKAIPGGIREKYKGRIWLQPDGYHMEETWKKAYSLAMDDPRLRVGVQLHKLMDVQ